MQQTVKTNYTTNCGLYSLYFKNQLKSVHGAELKLAELQTKYSGMEKQNFELSEKVNSCRLHI